MISSHEPRRRWSDTWLAQPAWQGFLLLLILLVIFFWRPLFTGQVLLTSDLLFEIDPLWQPLAPPDFSAPSNRVLSDQVLMFYPWKKFAVEQLMRGRLPLWNPYINGGHPFLANGQSALFDPFNVLTYWLPLDRSLVAVAFLRLLCAGAFTLLLALALGMSRAAAYLAMVVFTFGGPQIVWLLYTKASVLVWLPALIFFSERLIRNGRGLDMSLLGFASAAQVAGGHPESSIYLILVWLAYAGYRLYQAARTQRAILLDRAIKFALAGLLGLLVSAVHWLPLAGALWHSAALGEGAALDWRAVFLDWQAWPTGLTTVLPDYFGNPRDNTYWYPYSNYNDQTFFAGVIPLCFALLALLMAIPVRWGRTMQKAPRFRPAQRAQASPLQSQDEFASFDPQGGETPQRRQMAFFVVLLLAGFALAIRMPGVTLLAELPGFNLLNSPRLRGVYLFALAILAGYGLDLFLRSVCSPAPAGLFPHSRRSGRRVLAWLFAGIGLGAALVVAGSYFLVTLLQEQLVELGRQQALAGQGNPFFYRPLADYLELAEVRVQQMRGLFHPSNWKMYLPLLLAAPALLGLRALARPPRRIEMITVPVLLLTVGELWLFGIRYNPTLDPQSVYPTPRLIGYLQSRDDSIYRVMGVNLALIPNVSMVFSLQDVRGYEPVTPKRYMDLISRLDGALRIGDHLLFTHANAAFLDFLNVKYAFSAAPLGGDWIPLLQDGDATLYENRNVLPRAFLVYEGRWAASPEESLAMTLAADFDFRQSVVLEGDLQSNVSPRSGAAPASGAEYATADPPATVTSYQPEQITVQVHTPAPGFLVLSESYAPGWVASVDGEPVNLLIANHAFRAVRVPAGEHRVTFHYRPIWFTWGAPMSIIGLVLLVFLPVLGKRRWFTPSRQAASIGREPRLDYS